MVRRPSEPVRCSSSRPGRERLDPIGIRPSAATSRTECECSAISSDQQWLAGRRVSMADEQQSEGPTQRTIPPTRFDSIRFGALARHAPAPLRWLAGRLLSSRRSVGRRGQDAATSRLTRCHWTTTLHAALLACVHSSGARRHVWIRARIFRVS
jgi:hypothetical protein